MPNEDSLSLSLFLCFARMRAHALFRRQSSYFCTFTPPKLEVTSPEIAYQLGCPVSPFFLLLRLSFLFQQLYLVPHLEATPSRGTVPIFFLPIASIHPSTEWAETLA